ncbi:MAG: YIP1 family protein [Pseudothermotoga sp.]
MKNRATFSSILPMMFNPGAFIESRLRDMSVLFSLLVSALGFGLFFMQTGLDLFKTGQKSMNFVYTITAAGVVYGALFIPLLGVLLWIFLKIARSKASFKETISAMCLSYSSLLVYTLFGIIFSVFLNWRTSVVFGTSGVVWSMGTLMGTIRQLSNGKIALSVFLATIFGVVVLFSWYYLGNL